jgi:hypothetical protein
MATQTTVVIFAILAPFGLLAIVVVDAVLTTQEAEAKLGERCIPGLAGYNGSHGRCFHSHS